MISPATVGQNYLQVKCVDGADNIVYGNSSFFIEVDENAPLITRIFQKSGQLTVFTDENAKCYVSKNRLNQCLFDNQNATLMTGFAKEHKVPWVFENNYYIRCEDNQGNYDIGCNKIIKPV